MAQVFISYSRKDKEFVRHLGDALVAQKREAWVDWKDIPLTAEWQQEIFNNIEAADNFELGGGAGSGDVCADTSIVCGEF